MVAKKVPMLYLETMEEAQKESKEPHPILASYLKPNNIYMAFLQDLNRDLSISDKISFVIFVSGRLEDK